MKKKRIWIIVILVIIIITGLFLFSWKKGTCGTKSMGEHYDLFYCDRSCILDKDCKFDCGCGAINKGEQCEDNAIYDCVDKEVGCENGKCEVGEEASEKIENNKENMNNSRLQDCSRTPGQIKECPEGFICYESLGGGLGPEGPLPIESMGGDKKCHKECFLDKDCPIETPICILKDRGTEDYSEAFYLCFSEEEGEAQRDSIYNNCIEQKKDTISRDELLVSFHYNSTYEEIEKLLQEKGIKIIRKGGIGSNAYVIEPPSENPLEKICELIVDNRITDIN